MDLQAYIELILEFLNDQLIPLLISVAFLFFLWNVTRYFIIEGDNEESRERARGLAIWGILAFVLITAIWGIVGIFVQALGFKSDSTNPPTFDYIEFRDRNHIDTSDDTIFPGDPFNDD